MTGLFIFSSVLVLAPIVLFGVISYLTIKLAFKNEILKEKEIDSMKERISTLSKEIEESLSRVRMMSADLKELEDKLLIYESSDDEKIVNFADEEEVEYFGNPSNISEELLEKNRLHDKKIEQIKEELELYRLGAIYNEDHEEIAKRYPIKPKHEYSE